MEICPAILEQKETEFIRQLEIYSTLFNQIDIDINIEADNFDGIETIPFTKVLNLIKSKTNKFGFHLMTTNPKEIIDSYLNSNIKLNNCIFYIHQETDIEELLINERYFSTHLAIVIKAESGLKGVEYYSQFPEVQLMAVSAGMQGNEFRKEVLEKARVLSESGYLGKISIDGDVNEKTAQFIKNYKIDRVSVGSYFSQSTDIKTSLEKLRHAFK